MSGIAGIIHFDGKPVEPGLVEKMTTAMAHRGPDGIHHWVKGSIGLGQCMLRTTPESLEETQPLTNEDASLVLVMDGRVDNWEELRGELLVRGAVLRDRSDAELVLRAYQIWGRECLPHIDGDFALAIWDARRQEAFCARDRMGNKPFYYHWDGKTLAFASELQAILALPWMKQEPNEGMLAEMLAAEWYSRDETLWNGILRLIAAHQMVAGNQGPRLEQYWEPNLWAMLPFRKDEEYIEHYRELLFECVRRSSRSHRPVAIEVSGGLDSSAVFCVAEHLRRSNRLLTHGINGYTLGFTEEEGDASELPYARAVGGYLGLRIHETPPSRMPLSWFAERARSGRQFPGFPNLSMQAGLWQQTVAHGSRVTLGGHGGDQWLEGSRAYYAEALAQVHLCTLYDCLKTDATAFGARQAVSWLIRQGFFPLLPIALQEGLRRLVRRMRGSGTSKACYWLSPRMGEVIRMRRELIPPSHHRRVRSVGQRALLEALYDAYDAQAMEDLDCMSAHCGIEMRYPLDDPKLVQYAFSLPERLRLRGDRTKYIHIQALKNLLPKRILERKSKAEFSIVLREHLDRMQAILTETIPDERSTWVDRDGMARLFRAYRDNPQAGMPKWILWGIYGCHVTYIGDC
ncbi:MAG: asparagine synthase (glutamine-hydrolyzing) [Mesorhizobium sp.]|uniref:asparagine synthase (glutamine-hydrolyzing) n=1 Tax=Mesorhizobium sp. TaxID=1871066 RepID=UPI000FE5F894|nr:asparagine synthase (glutamine-hydrolyzing) [Mesorhizobium sp.]RWQ39572.1 MAG: asparagine synthase (glutamine-hydrolyzing) [Mesorhizobium sp.]TIL22763.1 MAG: asparagine synthase (glutamine-hydrolyzing) [Mesorhizobium sp.]